MFTSVARFGALALMVMVVLPLEAASAQTLWVSTASVSAQSSTGQDAPSQTVAIRNAGNKALKWTVGPVSFDPAITPWLRVSPSRGTQGGSLVLTFQTAAVPVGSYRAWFGIDSNGGSATVTVQLSVVAAAVVPVPPPPPPVPTLAVSCPANQSVASQDGNSVVVNYSATTSGGAAPITVTGNPASGSAFPVGTTSVSVTARSSDGQVASCSFTLTVTYAAPPPPPPPPPPPSTSAVGPQSTITCPAGSVNLSPGDPIPQTVGSFPNNTTFCLRAGVHYLTSAIRPKTGDVFVGEYGAVLDGSGWSTSDDTQAAFRAHNEDIDYVTIRNLVIRNMPQRGIHAYYYLSDHWTVEYTEIASSKNAGIVFPGYSTIRNNYIHHNSLGGYQAPYAHYSVVDSNEIAYNGTEQKIAASTDVTFRNNFVHHNMANGIWYDWDNTNGLIEGNRVEDNGRIGIVFEVSRASIIRNNIIRRSADAGVFLGTSRDMQIYNNTLDNNFRGITYFLDCPSLGGTIASDLTNNTAYDNTITVGTQSGAFASLFSYASCTTTQVAPYVNGSKNLTFSHNTYHVPLPTTGAYWLWNGTAAPVKYWNTWQAIPQDVTGTVSQ